MTKSEYLNMLNFNSFERYPQQFLTIYLKCEGTDNKMKEHVSKFIRVNQFNATTFDPKEVANILNNKNVEWTFSWLPADEIDEAMRKTIGKQND